MPEREQSHDKSVRERSYIPGKHREVQFFLGNWIAVPRGFLVDGNLQQLVFQVPIKISKSVQAYNHQIQENLVIDDKTSWCLNHPFEKY